MPEVATNQYVLPFTVRQLATSRFLESGMQVDKDEVDSPTSAWLEMATRWELIDDLLGGTLAMRAAGPLWLPREPKEDWDKYIIRLSRAVLYPGFEDAIDRLVDKPFSKDVTIKGELPKPLEKFADNVDREGTSLTDFGAKLFRSGGTYGKFHFMVDFPNTDGQQTAADEETGEVRAYFTMVPAASVIGWRWTVDPKTGEKYATMIRARDCYQREKGSFGTETVHRIRVWEPGTWQVWERVEGAKQFVMVSEGLVNAGGKPLDRIPMVTRIFKADENETFFCSRPPLEGLAWTNLRHWQSAADHTNLLRFARVGILFGKGFTQDEAEKGINISPNMALISSSSTAELSYLEQGGSSIQAGERDCETLEKRMEAQGAEPFIERSQGTTATGKAIDEGGVSCTAQRWARLVESALLEGLLLAHKFHQVEPDEKLAIEIFDDFAIVANGASDIPALISLRTAPTPMITAKTLLHEMQRRNVISADIDVEDELDQLEEEVAKLAEQAINQFGDPGQVDSEGNPVFPPKEGGVPGDKPPPPRGNPFNRGKPGAAAGEDDTGSEDNEETGKPAKKPPAFVKK